MTPQNILRQAAILLETKGWTQKAFARKGQVETIAVDPNADCFCMLGAVDRVCHDAGIGFIPAEVNDALDAVTDYQTVIAWNDNPKRKVEQVTAALRKGVEIINKRQAEQTQKQKQLAEATDAAIGGLFSR